MSDIIREVNDLMHKVVVESRESHCDFEVKYTFTGARIAEVSLRVITPVGGKFNILSVRHLFDYNTLEIVDMTKEMFEKTMRGYDMSIEAYDALTQYLSRIPGEQSTYTNYGRHTTTVFLDK